MYNNLFTMQRENVDQRNITELRSLDLAALLRIFDRNWFVITSVVFVNNRERRVIRDMMEVRNTWTHKSNEELSKEKVIKDVEMIIELMQAVDASMSDTILVKMKPYGNMKSRIKGYATKLKSLKRKTSNKRS